MGSSWTSRFAASKAPLAAILLIGSLTLSACASDSQRAEFTTTQAQQDESAQRAAASRAYGNYRGRPLYLIPLGNFSSPSLNQLAADIKQQLNLKAKILPPVALPNIVWNRSRNQVIAEELVTVMTENLQQASNQKATLIGVTSKDMYIRYRKDWAWGFGYGAANRFGVISSARMDPVNLGLDPDPSLLRTRLRKMTLKYVGILYYGLSESHNPTSVLYSPILSVPDLDRIGEKF